MKTNRKRALKDDAFRSFQLAIRTYSRGGAILVAAIFTVLCRKCANVGEALSGVVICGGVGALIDALHGGRETLYLYRRRENVRGSPPATVAWTVRF
jgi:hypothetical protein